MSLIPLTDSVTGISTKGLEYNLEERDFYIDKDISLGVSNEILDKEAEVHIDNGTLILMETND